MPEAGVVADSEAESVLTFACGGDRLVGILSLPSPRRSDIGFLVVVGGPQYRVGSHRQFVVLARTVAAAGFPVFRFDYRGMGDSTGTARSFEAISEDIRAAIDIFITKVPEVRSVVVFGLCDAASAALMYCDSDSRVRALVIVNPWVRTEVGQAFVHRRHYYPARVLSRSFWLKLLRGQVDVVSSATSFLASLRRSLSASLMGEGVGSYIDRMAGAFGRFRGSTLLLISERDLTAQEFVDLCHRSQDWSRLVARSNVRQVRLPGADHTFSTRVALEVSNREIVSWLLRQALSG